MDSCHVTPNFTQGSSSSVIGIEGPGLGLDSTLEDDAAAYDNVVATVLVPSETRPTNFCEGEEPFEGKEFLSQADAYNYYNAYARRLGFGIRKEAADKSRKNPNVVVSRTYVCNKAGKKRMDDKRERGACYRRPDTKVGCGAKLKIKLSTSDTWLVSKFVAEHQNHDLCSPDKVSLHYSHKQRHRTHFSRNIMEDFNGAGMGPSVISKALNALYSSTDADAAEDRITPQQCTDYIRRLRKSNIGNECMSVIRHFQDQSETDPDFYFAVEVDRSDTFRSVFWADGRARESYLSLGDVVVFDVTYKTNHLSLPFAPFTGVNHHRQSTLFGCALLADEQEETFVWLFTQWLKCMHGVAPKAIITDQDGRMKEAIKKVFPNSRHRFCAWHVAKHIGEQIPTLRSQYGEDFEAYFHRWHHASTVSKCEERWTEIKEKFGVNENENCWLSKMYSLRQQWVNCYLKDTFWAGMRTSQRSESINAFFDGYVNAKTKLTEFVTQYEKAILSRREAERNEDFSTLNSTTALLYAHPIEEQMRTAYTRTMFFKFQNELAEGIALFRRELSKDCSKTVHLVGKYSESQDKWEEVTFDRSKEVTLLCTCGMFETDGLLCRHILNVMWHDQLESVPPRYILHRWKIEARHRNIGFQNVMKMRAEEGDGSQSAVIRLWALRAKFNSAIELVSGSDSFLTRLEVLLEEFITEAEKEIVPDIRPTANPQHGSQVDSNAPLLLRNGVEVHVKDPDGPVRTKGRPKNATRLKSGFEISQENKEIKRRRCGNCQELGHYRSSCPQLVYASSGVRRHPQLNMSLFRPLLASVMLVFLPLFLSVIIVGLLQMLPSS